MKRGIQRDPIMSNWFMQRGNDNNQELDYAERKKVTINRN
jgi:hypothetical protein